MNASQTSSLAQMAQRFRFGAFDLDLQEGELRKHGIRIKLQQKPLQILGMLVRTPGAFVTRTQLAQHLWPGLHVRFDGSLNTAVNSLRQALGDSPRNPRFIETRPGRGYRFIAPVVPVDEPANQLDPQSEWTENQLAKKHANFAAYQDYLKGRSFCNKMSEEDVRKSIAYFEAALAQAPQYALAHAGLADAHNLFAYFGTIPPQQARALSMEFTAKALAIDPELAEAHTSLAGIEFLYDWDWNGAQKQFLKALELNPNYAAAHQRYADLLSAAGKMEEAMEQMRFAQQLEPLAPVLDMQMAWTCYVSRDFKRAEEESWKALAMEPRFAAAQQTLGLAYEQMSMYEEALVELENARSCSDNHPATVAALGHALASAGKRDEAAEMLRQLEHISQRRYVSGYWRSILYCGLGAEELALEWLDNAFQERDVWLIWLKVEPRLDRLRHTARFEQLLQQIGLG
jgi:DNA-binding winged helix-turn-helix (wHTH) protein/Tfp pilus assembly protein PilF